MLLLLGLWAVLLAVALPVGAACVRLVAPGQTRLAPADRFCLFAWCGLFALGSLLLALSLWTPLAPAPGIGIAVLAAAVALMNRRARDELRAAALSRRDAIALLPVGLACAFAAAVSLPPGDTGLYHYPLIRWLADTGTVPGLALLHYRFGLSSSWLALAAPLDAGPWTGRVAALTGGLGFLLLASHLAIVAPRALRTEADDADRFLAIAYAIVLVAAAGQSLQGSPSPNLAPAVAIVLSAWMLLRAREGDVPNLDLAIVLAAGGTAVKLVTAPSLVVAIAARAFAGNPRRAGTALGIAALLIGPLLIANARASGCWLFPAAVSCMDGPSSVGTATAAAVTSDVLNWARYADRSGLGMPFMSFEWIPAWTAQPRNLGFLAAIVAGVVAFCTCRGSRGASAAGLAGAIYFLVAAPDVRFAAGYIAILGGAAAACPRWPVSPIPAPMRGPAWSVIVAGCVVALGMGQALRHGVPANAWLAPDALPGARTVARVVNGVRYRVTTGTDECWAETRPCAPYEPPQTLRLCDSQRGERGGFCR